MVAASINNRTGGDIEGLGLAGGNLRPPKVAPCHMIVILGSLLQVVV